jgi:hypothetical protein
MKKTAPAVDDMPEMKQEDAAALQALARGDALEHQQKHALDFIIHTLAGTYMQSFRPDPHETAFMEGRRAVGRWIVKYVTINLKLLKGTKDA